MMALLSSVCSRCQRKVLNDCVLWSEVYIKCQDHFGLFFVSLSCFFVMVYNIGLVFECVVKVYVQVQIFTILTKVFTHK